MKVALIIRVVRVTDPRSRARAQLVQVGPARVSGAVKELRILKLPVLYVSFCT
jgi:hypothetical protein